MTGNRLWHVCLADRRLQNIEGRERKFRLSDPSMYAVSQQDKRTKTRRTSLE
ncbi:hypothetical protein PILCRDRAFT_823353 [Piloderma croceum F 1598]|uniref:Uncharacterized protein n=1 Tax=Piloderma croceum (strain F 1598) TaxID=765440 RepID=A0A0C3FI23_PILCF|nr:hypothetical protein PILCRDRAFT_823353 [Piloderma croceum F 1598]